jgi:hypothetical protein
MRNLEKSMKMFFIPFYLIVIFLDNLNLKLKIEKKKMKFYSDFFINKAANRSGNINPR